MMLAVRFTLSVLMAICNVTFAVTTTIEPQKKTIKSVGFKKLCTLKGHANIVRSMKVLKNGLLASGSNDDTLRIWCVEGTNPKHTCYQVAHINTVEELVDGRIACGTNARRINLWDGKTDTYTLLAFLQYDNSVIQLSSDNIAFSAWDQTIKIWDIYKDECLKTIDAWQHTAWISSLIELKNSGYLATASWDKTIKIWDPSRDSFVSPLVKTFSGHTNCINVLCQLDDQNIVSASDDKTIMIWNIDSNDGATVLRGHDDGINALLVVNKKIISGSHDKTVKIWDSKSKICLVTIPCIDKIYSLAYSSNKQYLFVGLGCGDIEVFQLFF